jgi:CRISPR/Cas system CSM-associated protein Csm3 (group 7 of RAMP superfamily)
LLYAPDEDGPAWSPSAPQCPTPGWVDEGKDVTEAGEEEFAALCPTCTLFGSPILAGKVRIPDLEVDEQTFGGQIEIRDGVGIDRDRGRAVDQVKFDYEAIPSGTGFEFSLTVDSPDVVELGLAAIAIREMQEGHLAVGGKTTRGMGHCVLSEVAIEDADFGSVNGMASYFQRRAEGETSEVADPDAYLDERIEDLFASA